MNSALKEIKDKKEEKIFKWQKKWKGKKGL